MARSSREFASASKRAAGRQVNQLGHPYQGSMYHGFARSAGLSYWESLLYTFAGSAVWEIAGETTPPSKNDQVASGIGGLAMSEVSPASAAMRNS